LAVLWMAEGRTSDARTAIDKVTSDFKLETLSPGDLASIAGLQLAVGEQEKAAATLVETQHVLSGRSYITEETVPVAIAAARLDAGQGHTATATKRLEQAKTEAQKLDLLPLVLEARLAMAEIAARSGDGSEAAALAHDASQAGFGLIAGKANAIAHSQKR
jgi:hypothetical protein